MRKGRSVEETGLAMSMDVASVTVVHRRPIA